MGNLLVLTSALSTSRPPAALHPTNPLRRRPPSTWVLALCCRRLVRSLCNPADTELDRPADCSSSMTTIPARLAQMSRSSTSLADAQARARTLYRDFYRGVRDPVWGGVPLRRRMWASLTGPLSSSFSLSPALSPDLDGDHVLLLGLSSSSPISFATVVSRGGVSSLPCYPARRLPSPMAPSVCRSGSTSETTNPNDANPDRPSTSSRSTTSPSRSTTFAFGSARSLSGTSTSPTSTSSTSRFSRAGRSTRR